ncbi:MAG: tetratricopeptide repeat protein, partial [Acidobacteriota bacterium]
MSQAESSDAPSTSRRWLFRLLALIGAPVIFFLALEGGLRLAGQGYDAGFFVPADGRDTLRSNPKFGWRFFPPSLARRPVAQDLSADKADGTLRLAVLGGSAAMGIPDPLFSFGRFLAVMVEESTGQSVEVVPMAMTAINSHVVRDIAGELDRIEPDVVAIYLGNNEIVGPWGLGGLDPDASPPGLPAIRASAALLKTRTGQTLSRLLRPPRAGGWRGLESFSSHGVTAEDPRLEGVRSDLASNLKSILERAHRTGAEVLISTVAVDLLGTPPFRSMAVAGPAESRRVDELLEEAGRALDGRDPAAARRAAREAVDLAPQHALAHFLLGRAALEEGDVAEARLELAAARDLDGLRFRADSEVNRTIRRLAAEDDALLVDAEAVLESRSPVGVPGAEFFFEHVHLTPEGAFEVARAFFLAWRGEEPPGFEACADRLGLTVWHRLGQWQDIAAMMDRPPFTAQWRHGQRRSIRLGRVAALADRLDGAGTLDRTLAAVEGALGSWPDDVLLRRDRAELLRDAGRADEAVAEIHRLLERLPGDPGLWIDAGNASLDAGAFDEAAAAYRRAEIADPHQSDGPFNLGALEVRRGRYPEALDAFDRTLAADPGHLEAALNRAAALEALGRRDEAIAAFRRVRERHSDRPVAHHRLAQALDARGDVEARAILEATVQRFPQDGTSHFLWAVRLGSEGLDEEAIRHLGLALRLEPGLDEARRQ